MVMLPFELILSEKNVKLYSRLGQKGQNGQILTFEFFDNRHVSGAA